MMEKLLILTDWYLPAQKAGGPIKSIHNVSNLLKDNYDVSIFTSNQEFEEARSTLNVESDCWSKRTEANLFYSSKGKWNIRQLTQEIKSIKPQVLYLNSVFSLRYSILPLLLFRFGRLKVRKVVLAPRGMLQSGALKLKNNKKRLVLRILKLLGVYNRIQFHATDKTEIEDIVSRLGVPRENIQEIPNIPSQFNTQKQSVKSKNKLRLIFLARVSRKKNIAFALQCLSTVSKEYKVNFDIYGPEEEGYWKELMALVDVLPSNLEVSYKGALRFDEVEGVLARYDAYILPTLGENFGHSIFEALSAGLPVIISDQTPWRKLESAKAGFDIPLDRPQEFTAAIERFAQMSNDEFQQWSSGARAFADNFISEQNYLEQYTALFSNPVKVGFVAPITFKRYRGGISVFAEDYLKRSETFKSKNIELIHINTCLFPRTNESTGKFNLVNLWNYILFLLKARKLIKKNRIEVLHYNTSIGLSLLKDAFTARLVYWFTGVRSILHIHFADLTELHEGGWYRKLLIWLLKNRNEIVVLSQELKVRLLTLGLDAQKVNVIRNYSMLEVEANTKIPTLTRRILFVGSVDQRKGVLDLIKALGGLDKEMDWKLDIAGDFTSEAFKEQFNTCVKRYHIQDRINLHGYVTDENKSRLFRDAAILVLPSYSEGMPLSILEGLSAGCAIVATDVGTNRETISQISRLITPGNIIRLSRELKSLLTNKTYLEQRQKQSLEISKDFSFQSFIDKIIPVYLGI